MTSTNNLSLLNVAGLVISAVPLYGYFVHASLDSQVIGLLIIFAWVLTCFFAISSFAATMIKNSRGQESTKSRNLTGYFFLAGALGYGGVHPAFFELIAG